MSKAKVIGVLDQKISSNDNEGKTLEKAFYKGSGGQAAMKDFLDQLLLKRKEFHKYQILKVKLN